MTRRVILIGDVHARVDRLVPALDLVADMAADLVILSGDIGRDPPRPWRPSRPRQAHDDSVREVVDEIRRRLAAPVAFVPGNHDLPDPPADVDGINVDGRVAEIAGLRVAGFGGAERSRLQFAYEWSEEAAEAALTRTLDGPVGDIDIFVSHAPPGGTRLDVTASGEAVGSPAVRRWLGIARPRLFVCGHIHEARGFQLVDGVPCLNAGGLGNPHARIQVWVVEWRDGPRQIVSHRLDERGDVQLCRHTIE